MFRKIIAIALTLIVIIGLFALYIRNEVKSPDYRSDYDNHKEIFIDIANIMLELYASELIREDMVCTYQYIEENFPQHSNTFVKLKKINKKYEPFVFFTPNKNQVAVYFGGGGFSFTLTGIAIVLDGSELINYTVENSGHENVSFDKIDEGAYLFIWNY